MDNDIIEDFIWKCNYSPYVKKIEKLEDEVTKARNDGMQSGKAKGRKEGRKDGKKEGREAERRAAERTARDVAFQHAKALAKEKGEKEEKKGLLDKEQKATAGLRSGISFSSKFRAGTLNDFQKSLYTDYFNEKKNILLSNTLANDNQRLLLSTQKQLIGLYGGLNTKGKEADQTIDTDITMNERVMDYDFADSGSNERLYKLMYILSLVLILATVCILFLKRFSLM